MKSGRRLLLLSGASRAALSLDFTTGSLDSRITFSRPSLATMYDSTGKLTYCPNNLLTYSNTFSNAAWLKVTTNLASGVSDPFGGTNAWTATATATNSYFNTYAVAGGASKFIGSIYIRRRTGTGTIRLQNPDGTQADITITASWQRFNTSVTGPAGSVAYIQVLIATLGDEIDIYGAQLEAVTYQTTPSTYVATTASAYYGPRFDYNPSTLAARGLLIEESRTNICTYSSAFTNAAWGAKGYVTDNFATAPDGTTTAAKINNTGATDNVAQTISVTAGTAYTFSFFAKNNGGTTASYRVYNLTGSADIVAVTSYFSQINSSTWTRVSVTFTAPVGCTQAIVYISASNSSTENVLVWGAQVEAGSFATSYIATRSSSVARSADSVSITGLSFPNAAFTLLHSFEVGQSSGSFQLGDFYDSTTPENNRLNWYGDNTVLNFFYKSGGAAKFSDSFSTVAANTRYKFGLAVTTNDAAKSRNGSAAASVGTTFAMGSSINSLKLGGNYAGIAGQTWHASLAIYASRLPNTRLQALTT